MLLSTSIRTLLPLLSGIFISLILASFRLELLHVLKISSISRDKSVISLDLLSDAKLLAVGMKLFDEASESILLIARTSSSSGCASDDTLDRNKMFAPTTPIAPDIIAETGAEN